MKCWAGWITSWNQNCWQKNLQLQICIWYHSHGRKWRVTKEPLDEGERGKWKTWLKINIQKTKIIAYSPITSWQIDGRKVETVTDFIFSGSKITAEGDCSHQIKRRLLLGRKAMRNVDSVVQSRDITWPTKVYIVKSYGFSSSHAQMWELDHKEGWVPKN